MTLKAQPRSCVFSHLEVYVFGCIFHYIFMYHKSYFLYDECYGISSDRKVLSSKYVMNLDVRVDRSSD